MDKLQLISELCESRVFRHRAAVGRFSKEEAFEFFYAYLLALLALSLTERTQGWAQEYASKAAAFNNFDHFRVSANDIYVLAFIVNQHKKSVVTFQQLVKVLRGIGQGRLNRSEIEPYLLRLERALAIDNSRLRSIRRVVTNWPRLSRSERSANLGILRRIIASKSRLSEILPHIDVARREGSLGPLKTAGVLAAAGLGGFALGLRYDPRSRKQFLRPVIGEGVELRLDEKRPTQLAEVVAGLKAHPMIDRVISAKYMADGITAFVRTVDGNAYEFQIRAAPEAKGFERERGEE